jgi:hypothetical protein
MYIWPLVDPEASGKGVPSRRGLWLTCNTQNISTVFTNGGRLHLQCYHLVALKLLHNIPIVGGFAFLDLHLPVQMGGTWRKMYRAITLEFDVSASVDPWLTLIGSNVHDRYTVIMTSDLLSICNTQKQNQTDIRIPIVMYFLVGSWFYWVNYNTVWWRKNYSKCYIKISQMVL